MPSLPGAFRSPLAASMTSPAAHALQRNVKIPRAASVDVGTLLLTAAALLAPGASPGPFLATKASIANALSGAAYELYTSGRSPGVFYNIVSQSQAQLAALHDTNAQLAARLLKTIVDATLA